MRVILCTCPVDKAESLAGMLVEGHLAACVNIVPRVVSVYQWEGKIEKDDEALMIIKTVEDRVEALTRTLRSSHPYDVPEIIALTIKEGEGNDDYLRWLVEETRPRG